MTWFESFLRQAQSNLDVYRALQSVDVPRCHRLHYLQMSLEKSAKAIQVRHSPTVQPTVSHETVDRMTKLLHQDPVLMKALGYRGKESRLAASRQLRKLALGIERLAPAAGAGENTEYPWERHDGSVACPATEAFRGVSEADEASLAYWLLRLTQTLKDFA